MPVAEGGSSSKRGDPLSAGPRASRARAARDGARTSLAPEAAVPAARRRRKWEREKVVIGTGRNACGEKPRPKGPFGNATGLAEWLSSTLGRFCKSGQPSKRLAGANSPSVANKRAICTARAEWGVCLSGLRLGLRIRLLELFIENAGRGFAVEVRIGTRLLLLGFLGGIQASEFGAHSGGVFLAANLGVGIAQREINLSLLRKAFAGGFKFRDGFGGAIGIEIEQTQEVVGKGKLWADADGLLGVSDAVGRIDAVSNGGDFQQCADVMRILLQFLAKLGDGLVGFGSVEQEAAESEVGLGIGWVFG